MSLVKILIEIAEEDRSAAKAAGLPQRIAAQFNPTEYGLDKGVNFAEIAIPGLEEPLLQFTHGNSQRLALELLLDGTKIDDPLDVGATANDLQRLVRILPEKHAPPRIKVVWGPRLIFKAVAESVNCRFTLFSPDGVPLRARVSLALRSYRTLADQLRELNLQSPDHTKQHRVRAGDTLALIAYEAYGDPALWRAVAAANLEETADPRRLGVGVLLDIPPLATNSATGRP
jgi:nucleoid-associated protein YgaU